MMKEKLRLAIIGCGAVAEYYHLPVLQRMPEYEISHLVDLNEEQALSVKKRYGLASEIETKYDTILKNKEIDAVMILTPPHLHKDQIIAAANANKDIFCEKPVAMNPKETQEIIDVCEANNVSLLAGYQMRFDGKYSKIKEMIEKKLFGKLIGGQGLHFANAFKWPSVSQFQLDKKRGGGALFEMMHFVDLSTWFFGKARSMNASVSKKRKKSPIDDTANLNITFENDVSVALSIGWNTITVNSFTIYGTEGYVRSVSDTKKLLYHAKDFLAQPPIQIKPNHSISPFQDELLHFYKIVKNNKKPIVTSEQLLQNAQIVHAAYDENNKDQTIILGD